MESNNFAIHSYYPVWILELENASMNQKGIPIYPDSMNREVADSLVEGEVDVDAWYPSNKAAHKLWRCLECLRDLDDLLDDAIHQKNATKRKRRLKIAITPLHSLVLALDDLLNDIQCNKETSNLLEEDEVKQVEKIKEQFALMLPHDNKAPLSIVRNKLSAHIDKQAHPDEVRRIGVTISPSEFGRWLHICLHLVLDLTKLDIYWWTCDSHVDGYIRLMSNEPFLVTFKIVGKDISEIAGIHIAKESPKNCMPAVIDSLITNSLWMFKPNQPHISSLKEDAREEWNTFLNNYVLTEGPSK